MSGWELLGTGLVCAFAALAYLRIVADAVHVRRAHLREFERRQRRAYEKWVERMAEADASSDAA